MTIPPGEAGVEATVRWIRRFVDQAVRSTEVNRFAVAILDAGHAREYDQRSAAQTIYDWVRAHMRFVPDVIGYDEDWQPQGYETLRPIEEILRIGGGDCDDLNGVLLPSLFSSVGIPTRLVTVASDPDFPDEFSHIYPEVFIDGEWIAADAARPGARFGREPEYYTRKRIWGVQGRGSMRLGTLQGLPKAWEVPGHLRPLPVAREVWTRLHGLGQDEGDGGIDWGSLIESGIKVVPGIISAARTSPNLLPVTSLMTAQAQRAPVAVQTSSIMGMSAGTALLGVALLGVGFMLARHAK